MFVSRCVRSSAKVIFLRWRDWAALLLGIYLLFSPWLLGNYSDVVSSSNTWLAGVYALVVALLGLVIPGSRPIGWLKAALGCWLFVAPFAMGFEHPAASWNACIVATLLIASVGPVTLVSDLRIALRSVSLYYRVRRLSPEKIVRFEGSDEREQASPEKLSRSLIERTEAIHQALRKAPSKVETEMCFLGYQACADDLIALMRLLEKERLRAGPIRRARLKATGRRAAVSLARTRKTLRSSALQGLRTGN